MHITFYGAAREVTGSMHLIGTEQDRILLDCGMFQGKRKESDVKNRALPFNPKIITNAILSHAHIDHSGRIPMLTTRNFKGRVMCTRVTTDAARYLLPIAHIFRNLMPIISTTKPCVPRCPIQKEQQSGNSVMLLKQSAAN